MSRRELNLVPAPESTDTAAARVCCSMNSGCRGDVLKCHSRLITLSVNVICDVIYETINKQQAKYGPCTLLIEGFLLYIRDIVKITKAIDINQSTNEEYM